MLIYIIYMSKENKTGIDSLYLRKEEAERELKWLRNHSKNNWKYYIKEKEIVQ